MRRWVGLVVFVCAACGSFGGEGDPITDGSSDAGGSDGGTADVDVDGGAGASDATADGAWPDSSDASDAGKNKCPEGVGPKMREVKLANNRTICIDVTEVTTAQYASFRGMIADTAPLTAKVPSACGMIAAIALTPSTPDAGATPQVNVSFCSAAFFCAAHGKRLCGNAADGTAIVYDGGTATPLTEWELACANGKGPEFYPWGDQNAAVGATAKCAVNDATPTPVAPRAVGIEPTCGPPGNAGPFDMIGNVWEWVNVREDDPNGSYTGVRGGSFAEVTRPDGCGSKHGIAATSKEYAAGDDKTGFRCCADPP